MKASELAKTVFAAVAINEGRIRRVWFEAYSEDDAVVFCARFNLGFSGPSAGPDTVTDPIEPAKHAAYNEATARQLLGGISRATLNRMVVRGDLERDPRTRRLMITRRSLERYC